jgi:hypothetical protein
MCKKSFAFPSYMLEVILFANATRYLTQIKFSHMNPLKMLKTAMMIGCSGLVLTLAAQAPSEEVLDNKAIVSLVKAGLPEAVIVSKIKTSAYQFDLSTDGLLQLTKEGVPSAIINAMMDAGSKTVSK